MFLRDLVLFVSIFNLILAIAIMVNNWKYNRNIIFLTLFLIFFSIHIISGNLLFFGGSVRLFALLLNNFAPLFYLYPVMLYFYFRSTVNDNFKLKKSDIFHFIPFLINLIAVIPYWLTSFDYKYTLAQSLMKNIPEYLNCDFHLFYPPVINSIARPVQVVIYLIMCAVLLIKFRKKFKDVTGSSKVSKFSVTSLLLLIFTVFVAFNILLVILTFQMVTNNNIHWVENLSTLLQITAFLIPAIPLLFLMLTRLVYGFPQLNNQNINVLHSRYKVAEPRVSKLVVTAVKEDNTELEDQVDNKLDESFNLLSEAIIRYFENDKPYLKQGFSVHDVCSHLVAPRHHIQYCFNEVMGRKFTDLRNEYRVKYAMELLKSESFSTNSIEGIGRQSGFSTNVNFYISFRNFTGFTPNQWLLNYLKNSSK